TPENAPTLWDLVQNGVFFKAHHPVYISTTEVNGTAIFTGTYPEHSTIIANSEYRPEIHLLLPVATEGVDTVRRGDLQTRGRYLMVPTLCEILQKAGIRTAVASTKPVGFLANRSPRLSTGSEMIYAGKAIPSSLLPLAIHANGKESPATNSIPNIHRDAWT